MKKLVSVVLALLLLLCLTGCSGNYGSIDLQDPIAIPDSGIIEKTVLTRMKNENAIGTFTGQSNGTFYEWTIFGSDISEAADISLKVEIENRAEEGVQLHFAQEAGFGFPALLSVHLEDKWDAQSATVWQGDAAVGSVSVTGSKGTILNLSLDKIPGTCVIRPDALPEEPSPEETIQLSVPETQPESPAETKPQSGGSSYLSAVDDTPGRVYSDGGATGQDKYLTDPVPEGKPMPVEPEDQQVNTAKSYTCTFSIECSTILNNLDQLDPDKREMVPSSGVILSARTVTFYEGESVYDVLQRVCRDNGIHLEAEWTAIYNSAYIEGIHNLYEFDCGSLSGWMYSVNGWYPNYGCSRYQLQQGDVVQWRYTCDLGEDIGGGYAVGG